MYTKAADDDDELYNALYAVFQDRGWPEWDAHELAETTARYAHYLRWRDDNPAPE